MNELKNDICSLCNSTSVILFDEFRERKYYRCELCKLIFMDRNILLPPNIEKERYSHHKYDQNYDNYNMSIADKIAPFLTKGDFGIDFGCGQFNVLVKILTDKGFPTIGYDPFYSDFNNKDLLETKYDFVVSIETIEHFHNPLREFTIISNILTDEGKLFLRTQLYDDSIDFNSWWYIKDDTHVSLYSEHTLNFIRESFKLKLNSV